MIDTKTQTKIKYRDLLFFEGRRERAAESNDTSITEGLDEAKKYLHELELLDGFQKDMERADFIDCIKNMRREGVIKIAENLFPNGHQYVKARIGFGNFLDNGTPTACTCSELYEI